jgi:hypothetical protein
MSFRPFADVWMLARPKVKYFGAYPAGFLLRARDMLGVGKHDQVLHVCSGAVRSYKCGPSCRGQTARHFHGLGRFDLTLDLDKSLRPDITGDARERRIYHEIIGDNPQIQAGLADPPYNREFAAHYKVGASVLPTGDDIVRNMIDILPIGGRVGILSMGWPRYPKKKARQIAIIGVTVGNGNIGRWFAVFERTA